MGNQRSSPLIFTEFLPEKTICPIHNFLLYISRQGWTLQENQVCNREGVPLDTAFIFPNPRKPSEHMTTETFTKKIRDMEKRYKPGGNPRFRAHAARYTITGKCEFDIYIFLY